MMDDRLSYWPADQSAPLLDMTPTDLIAQAAREVPNRTAFVEADTATKATRRWSYAELFDTAQTVARALLRQFQPGERVAVWSSNCAEWVLLQHGAGLAGLVLVTVNPAYLGDEVSHVLAASKAAGLFFSRDYRGKDQRAVVESIAADLPHLRHRTCFSEWDAFLSAGDGKAALPAVSPGDMAQIQFTSGTTGRPKGACLHHRGLLNVSRFAAIRAEFPEGGVWVSAMPLFHVGGCAGSQFGAYSRFGTFVMLTQFDAGFMLEMVAQERGNHVHAVPTMVIAMMDHPIRPTLELFQPERHHERRHARSGADGAQGDAGFRLPLHHHLRAD